MVCVGSCATSSQAWKCRNLSGLQPAEGDAEMNTRAAMVRRLLMDEPDEALCDSCLALTCGTTLADMRRITVALRREGAFVQGSVCASCRRSVPTTIAAPKCAHCSLPFHAGDPGFALEGDRFHVHCLSRLRTDETIRLSRALSRRSRDMIEQSRRRMRNGPDCPPASK